MFKLTATATLVLLLPCLAQDAALSAPQLLSGGDLKLIFSLMQTAPVLTDFDGDGQADFLFASPPDKRLSGRTISIGFHKRLQMRSGDKAPRFAPAKFVKVGGKPVHLPVT